MHLPEFAGARKRLAAPHFLGHVAEADVVDLRRANDAAQLAPPVVHLDQVARRDVAELQAAITDRIADSNERIARSNERIAELDRSVSGRIAELDRGLSGRIAELDTRLTSRIAELDRGLSGRIAELDTRLTSRIATTNERIAETKVDLVRWMLAALTAQTALILGAFKLL